MIPIRRMRQRKRRHPNRRGPGVMMMSEEALRRPDTLSTRAKVPRGQGVAEGRRPPRPLPPTSPRSGPRPPRCPLLCSSRESPWLQRALGSAAPAMPIPRQLLSLVAAPAADLPPPAPPPHTHFSSPPGLRLDSLRPSERGPCVACRGSRGCGGAQGDRRCASTPRFPSAESAVYCASGGTGSSCCCC